MANGVQAPEKLTADKKAKADATQLCMYYFRKSVSVFLSHHFQLSHQFTCGTADWLV